MRGDGADDDARPPPPAGPRPGGRSAHRRGVGSFPSGGQRRHRGLVGQDLDLVEREPREGETQGHLAPTVVGAVVLQGKITKIPVKSVHCVI